MPLLELKANNLSSLQKQNVALALQVFDESTACALQTSEFATHSSKQTSIFLQAVIKLWKIWNCKSLGHAARKRDPDRRVIRYVFKGGHYLTFVKSFTWSVSLVGFSWSRSWTFYLKLQLAFHLFINIIVKPNSNKSGKWSKQQNSAWNSNKMITLSTKTQFNNKRIWLWKIWLSWKIVWTFPPKHKI